MNSTSASLRAIAAAALLASAPLALQADKPSDEPDPPGVESAREAVDEEIYQCVLSCDRDFVDYSRDIAGPGADLSGARKLARDRYALCLYHCDPRLSLHGTLMRLFPPAAGRLARSRRHALPTEDRLALCLQDCETSEALCREQRFAQEQVCLAGADACQRRCEAAFGAIRQDKD